MTMAKKQRNVRLHVVVDAETRKRIDELQQDAGLASITDVIRNALAHYRFLMDHHKEGAKFIIRTKDGEDLTFLFR